MARWKSYDKSFFFLAMLLLGIGILALTSASINISIVNFGHPYYYILHQALFGIIPGIALLWIAAKTNYELWKRLAIPLLLFALFLMFLVLVPSIGFSYGGARRWISIGQVSFQPSELLKFAYIVYLAAWFESRSREIRSFVFGSLPFLIMNGFIASFLVLQPDIGTLGVLMITAIALFAVSGGTLKQICVMAIIGAIIFGIIIMIEPYRMARVAVFFNQAQDPQGIGYQMRQALIAIGSGGIWGRGLALSRQKFNYLPEPMGDSIFAIIAEEFGFIGSVSLLIMLLLFYLRGIIIIRDVHDLFGKLLGFGALLLIIVQAIVNIAAISGVMPLTGIPLSFISYGGSSLAITLLEIGVILNISKMRL